jgi:hypothetical protein
MFGKVPHAALMSRGKQTIGTPPLIEQHSYAMSLSGTLSQTFMICEEVNLYDP